MNSLPTLNKVTLIGHVLKKPFIKFLSDTNALCSFTLGTYDMLSTNTGNEKKRITDYHTITCWNEYAKDIYKNISENQLIYIEGKLKNRKWTDKDGTPHHRCEIFLTSYVILSNNEKINENLNNAYPEELTNNPNPITGIESSELDNLPF